MEKLEKFFPTIIHYSLLIIIFLYPLFFLPFTQEFFITNKLYLLAFGSLFLLLLSNIKYLISKKLLWKSLPFDMPLILFVLTIGLSIIISSPNKIQALLSPHFGLLAILSLTILYFYLSRFPSSITHLLNYSITFSSLLLSLITIIFFFQPLKNTTLPQSFQFLKNPAFTPLGNQLDLAIFLGFFVVVNLSQIVFENRGSPIPVSNDLGGAQRSEHAHWSEKHGIKNFIFLTFNLLALSLTLYTLFKPTPNSQLLITNYQLPPFRLSWFAAVEVLKNPLNAAFGVGVDNFSSIFTKVKDLVYNQSPLWQINSFGLSRSAILHILTETGFFGLVAFGLLLFLALKNLISLNPNQSQIRNHLGNGREKMVPRVLFGYLLLIIALFPPSLTTFFLFFLFLASFSASNQSSYDLPGRSGSLAATQKPANFNELDLSRLLPFYLITVTLSFLLIAGGAYLLGKSYAAEYFFKKSLDGFAKNDAKQVYNNMRQAIILNPYIERYRLNFSQVNLMIANNVAAKANQPQGKEEKPYQLTEDDRQTIAQAIQAAISEAKAAVALNPQKASNWENLAFVYRNILNVAQGADVWTISGFQRAIILDPQNPIYRLNLGGTYYSLGNYEEAVKLFEQAVALKPDWPNAHYNLAWADYQRQNYQRAVTEMQNVLSLLDPKKEKTDYEKAQKDLEEFKKKLPKEESGASPSGQPSQLALPTPPAATLEPKIKLPQEASPEAK